MSDHNKKFSDQEALRFHSQGRPGKIEIISSKPMATQRDLSLAYSPGVAAPVRAISENPDCVYDYTAKGNLVAVITNGSAILGLGNLGALASKPVMEGKAVLFKRFADVDAIDLEIDSEDVEEFVNCVKLLGPSFGGINLEDIKAPECFIIEQALREVMDIPVFHDDQHGTAIITAAGIINALDLTGRTFKKTRIVVNGAGAAAIACSELIKAMGLPHDNLMMCDSKGVIYQGREEGMNQWKAAHAVKTKCRTLREAIKGADVFIGLSVKGAVDQKMIKSMGRKPIVFAMANPDPEITPEEIMAVRKDAIIATGRSDYPNQVNNVLGFPYIFRGALDVRARAINEEMKIAAAEALAELAREDVHDEVSSAYAGKRSHYGRDYIIPSPFDPRLIECIPPRVAKAAVDSGVARIEMLTAEDYKISLSARLNPTVGTLSQMFVQLQKNPRRVVFAEAEEERMTRAALSFRSSGYGTPILIGQETVVGQRLKEAGIEDMTNLEVHSARTSTWNKEFADFLYERLKRKGFLYRDIKRLVNRDRNVFGACMVALGHADAMVTGITRHYWQALKNVLLVIDPKEGYKPFAMSAVVTRNKTIFIADTAVNERPNAEELAEIATQAAGIVRILGQTPRVAFLSYSNFGNPTRPLTKHLRAAVKILEEKKVDFEFDGEMMADVALNPDMAKLYPFSRLTKPANILIMPGLQSANISYKLLAELSGGRVIGPILWGMQKSIQITRMNSTSTDILNMAGLAAIGSLSEEEAFFPGF
ncbi:MAG: NADP-dependent malic enzyme [Alphaproteobacteria bacterium]|nr:MAG: NADP-dependent malic enzyme [Alphaproteobacteria bacterium]